MTKRDVKDAIIALLKRGWTQKVGARNMLGQETSCYDSDAACWCLAGALGSVSRRFSINESLWLEVTRALSRRAQLFGYTTYVEFNDKPGRTVEEVINFVEKALA